MRRTLPLAAVLLVLSASAGAQPATAARCARLSFAVRAAGLRVFTIQVFVRLGTAGYRIDTLARTVGIAAFFHPGAEFTSASGTWAGRRALPAHYVASSHWGGTQHRTVIAYDAAVPTVQVRTGFRHVLPIAPAKLAGASNLPSAFMEMIRDTATGGRCETSVHAYNGRVLTDVVSRSDGDVELHEHAFAGPALRCDYASYALAGLPADPPDDDDPAPPLQRGTIWLGRVLPGYPALPVQISFLTHWFGSVTAHLTAARAVTEADAIADPLTRPHS